MTSCRRNVTGSLVFLRGPRSRCTAVYARHTISVSHTLTQCMFRALAAKIYYYATDRREGAISVAFVRPSVCPSVSLSVCPSVAYIANNSRTQRPRVSKFGMKVHHLRCDSHTNFKVKWSKVRVTDGRGHTVSVEPGSHTACL